MRAVGFLDLRASAAWPSWPPMGPNFSFKKRARVIKKKENSTCSVGPGCWHQKANNMFIFEILISLII
jgi:hypothetical protein